VAVSYAATVWTSPNATARWFQFQRRFLAFARPASPGGATQPESVDAPGTPKCHARRGNRQDEQVRNRYATMAHSGRKVGVARAAFLETAAVALERFMLPGKLSYLLGLIPLVGIGLKIGYC